MISARALGVYLYLRSSDAPISADSLARVFREGRKAMLSALQELREIGLVHTYREVINGKYVTTSKLCDGSPKKELLIQQSQQNSNLLLNAYSYISKKEFLGGPKEGEEMTDENYQLGQLDTDEDYVREQRRRDRERKHREYEEAKSAKYQARQDAKAARQPIDWSSNDSAYEFVRRMETMWHIKPWTQARTRFLSAFAQARKTHGTDGEIELKMMERFFSGLAHHKSIDDPERIWKTFIRDFGSLSIDVERSNVTPEDIAKAEETLKRQWEKY